MIILEVYKNDKLFTELNITSYEIEYTNTFYFNKGIGQKFKRIERHDKPWGVLLKVTI